MKVKAIFIILSWAVVNSSFGQCETITAEEVTNFTPVAIDSLFESDGLRNGPDYNGASLYYPLNGLDNYKSIVLVPGFFAAQSSVQDWARYLASRGYVSMTIGTNSFFDDPELRASALIDGMTTMRHENNRLDSPLYERIDTLNIAVGGWSMGGGGAQLAAKRDTSIKAVIAIAPWLNPLTFSPADVNHNSPVLILSGENDPTAPPVQHADVHYNNTPNTTNKLLFEIAEGDHSTPLFPTTGNGSVGDVAFAWLQLFLDEDPCFCELLKTDILNQNATASAYNTNINCSIISSFDSEYISLNIEAYPNPAAGYFVANFSSEAQTEYTIYDLVGQRIKNGLIYSGDHIDIEKFESGTYFLKIGHEILKIVKR